MENCCDSFKFRENPIFINLVIHLTVNCDTRNGYSAKCIVIYKCAKSINYIFILTFSCTTKLWSNEKKKEKWTKHKIKTYLILSVIRWLCRCGAAFQFIYYLVFRIISILISIPSSTWQIHLMFSMCVYVHFVLLYFLL